MLLKQCFRLISSTGVHLDYEQSDFERVSTTCNCPSLEQLYCLSRGLGFIEFMDEEVRLPREGIRRSQDLACLWK